MELRLEGISKAFGEKQVLQDVSFTATSGRAFGLLGRNGAGKTTTIRILMHVFDADCGQVLLDGKPLDHEKIGIGYLPEERGLYPKKVIFEQLVYFAMLKGMEKRAAGRAVDEWLERLSMTEYRNKRLDTLSKGNQQKIQLITALCHDPQIIILDEPFSGLDPVNALLLRDVVQEQMKRGKILLFSSHQMHAIEEFCDSIAILHKGQVAISGDLYDIKRSYVRDKLVIKSEACAAIRTAFPDHCKPLDENSLLLQMERPEDKADWINRLAGAYDLDGISVWEPSLQDIFVQVAGDGAGEEEKA